MSSELSDRVDRLERRADVQLQQTGDCKAAICRLAELVRRLKAEVYKDPEVPDAPPPVATDHDLYMAFSGNRDTAAALRAIYNLGRQHGADQLCPYIRSDDEGTNYCALAEQAAPAVKESPAPAPATSLVDRVGKARANAFVLGNYQDRAAIREVAAWLRKSDAKLEMGGDAAATADLLEQEAKR